MSIVPNGPIEFRSVKAMDEYIKANAGPIVSEHPCACGEPKEYGHRLASSARPIIGDVVGRIKKGEVERVRCPTVTV